MHKLYEGTLVLGDNPHVARDSEEATNYASDSCPDGFRTVRAQKIINSVKWFGKLWVPDAITDDEAFSIADVFFGKMINGEVSNDQGY